MNDTQITLTGWIGGEVTLREVAGGQPVASFRVACTPTRFRDGEWVKGTTSWHTVKAWNRLARHVAASLQQRRPRGGPRPPGRRRVGARGRPQPRRGHEWSATSRRATTSPTARRSSRQAGAVADGSRRRSSREAA